MQILILNWRDYRHPKSGGSEVYAQNLAKHWAAAGHKVTFFCSSVIGEAASEDFEGYRIVRRGSQLSVYAEAKRFYSQAGPGAFDAILDVVNTRPFLTPLWDTECNHVALIHQLAREVWRYEVPWPASFIGEHFLEPRWLRHYASTSVLTVSESSRESLRSMGLTRVSVVHEGVDAPLDRTLPPKATIPTVLFVGRLAQNKRPLEALQAFEIARESLPDLQFWVVGDGPQRAALERRAKNNVFVFGRVDAATKQDLMASAHALVATSVREGWGLTVSEAARLGTRAIGYDVPGLRDSIPSAGGVLSEAFPRSLAQAIVTHLPHWVSEERPSLGDAGVVSWSTVADEVLAHLFP